jgi:hypothetical protein
MHEQLSLLEPSPPTKRQRKRKATIASTQAIYLQGLEQRIGYLEEWAAIALELLDSATLPTKDYEVAGRLWRAAEALNLVERPGNGP